jgi:hypothetical protein
MPPQQAIATEGHAHAGKRGLGFQYRHQVKQAWA